MQTIVRTDSSNGQRTNGSTHNGGADSHITTTREVDLINKPPHYKGSNGIECIEAIEAMLTPEEFRGYLRGNLMKYLWRCTKKNITPLDCLDKAEYYLKKYRDSFTK